MAGHGSPPKFPEDRANRVPLARGEWLTLPPLSKKVLPPLPKGEWSTRTKRAWNAWRSSWVTAAYGPDEITMAIELAYLFEAMVQDTDYKSAGEVRQWLDRLGLTLKGKRDLRLRLEESEIPTSASKTEDEDFTGLRLVDEAV